MTTKTSIASNLTARLRDAVLRGDIAPNTKLRLEELSASFGVSMSPIREALVRLAGEGFVVSEDQRGFRVAEASPQHLAEVTALRAHIEPFALRLSIEQRDVKWEENLIAIFHRLTRIEEQDGFVPFLDEWEQAHRDFHLALAAGCRMPTLAHFCSMLHDQSDRYRRLYLQTLPPQRDVKKEHAAIVEAVLARDADRACALLLAHSRRTGETVLAFMNEPHKQRVKGDVQ